jgi:hypothetical protein
MNVRINQLVKSLLQKDSIDQCSIQELQQYAERHPYFGAAQLLLAKKMKAENAEQYNEQLQKTYLFFHNPLWVEALLNETGNAIITTTEKPVTIPEKEEKIEPLIAEEIKVPATAVFEPVEPLLSNNVIAEEIKPEPVLSMAAPIIEQAEINDQKTEITASTEEQPINIPALKIEPFDPAKAQLTFEPFYTVDYFASQGIKFKEDDKPKDKFGQNLKSFTDWLKIMKRLPVSEIAKNVNAATEQKVDQLAEHSLENREVLTEAMAEVWEKQGNKAKAIDIYSKLSLLDPPKSAYFAAKIEDLKKTN